MATWTSVPDTSLDVGKAARSVDIKAIRDNIIVVNEKVGIGPATGTNIVYLNDVTRRTEATSFPTYDAFGDDEQQTSVLVYADGTVNVYIRHNNNTVNDESQVRILKNGAVVQTWIQSPSGAVSRDEDVAVSYGDIITFQHRVLVDGSYGGGDSLLFDLRIRASIPVPVRPVVFNRDALEYEP